MSTQTIAPLDEKERKRLHVAITEAFAQAFAAKFGFRYAHQGGQDGSAVRRFIVGLNGVITPQEVTDKLNFAWGPNHKDTFVRENLLTISAFLSQWNRVSVLQARNQTINGGDKW